MPNSNDDASLHHHSLYSGGNNEETESQCDQRFAEGLLKMFPELRSCETGTRSCGGRSGEATPLQTPPPSGRQELATSPRQAASHARVPPGAARGPLAQHHEQSGSIGPETRIANAVPCPRRAPSTSDHPQESTQCISRDLDREGRITGPEQQNRRGSTGSIPPRAPGSAESARGALRNTISSVSKDSRHSRGRKKRRELLVRNFYSEVFVRKKDNSNLAPKHMCDYCHVVVGNSSECLLLHTGNCPKTPLVSKRNALEQSKAKTTPKIAIDSSHGAGREIREDQKASDRSRKVQNAIENGRSVSPLSSERRGKKRKLSETHKAKKSNQKNVTVKKIGLYHSTFAKAVVQHNLPLTICDRDSGYQNAFMEFMELVSPVYHSEFPSRKDLRDKHLSALFDNTSHQVYKNINQSLNGLHGFGTIMFDGWDDINGCSVVNIMIRISSGLSSQNGTYLLDSVYTKEKKVTADEYVKCIESVVQKLNPKLSNPFLGICGVVSDSAKACVKAKRLLAEKYTGMVSIQDQAHAADLLLSDIGQLPWVKSLLEKVSTIVQTAKNNRKLNSRFKDLIVEHNKGVKQLEIEDSWHFLESSENDDTTGEPLSSTTDGRQESGRGIELGLTPVRPTAVTLKTPAKTRFASSETMLESFVRSREVLKRLVTDPLFTELYDGTSIANQEKRNAFVAVVNDDNFFKSTKEVHELFRVARRYLRTWDAEGCQVSEVAPATILLEHDLNSIDVQNFCYVTQERKNDVLQALELRCKGPTMRNSCAMQVRIVQDVHYAAWVLDPVLTPSCLAKYLPAFKRHLAVYVKGSKNGMVGMELDKKVQEVTEVFKDVHEYWEHIRKDAENEMVLDSYAGTPMKWWDNEKVIPNDDLLAFAKSTLSLCPSSCATERSFSHQGRIHSTQRNRLKPDFVRELLFCKWNGLQLKKAKRTEWSNFTASEVLQGSVKRYYEFAEIPSEGLYVQREDAIREERRLRNMTRVQREIEDARTRLYQAIHFWTYTREETRPSAVATSTATIGDSDTMLRSDIG